jgi:arylsulfatase A-like enzyme
MDGPWDAPYDYRARLAEEGDPDPPAFTAPPEQSLARDYDPDLLLGIQQAYGAQVTLLDACLDVVLDAIWTGPQSDSTALIATAARGFPMGEHRYVGREHFPLYGELIQVPWLCYLPDESLASWRIHHTVQPPDLHTTLRQWFDIPADSAKTVWGRNLLRSDWDAAVVGHEQVACTTHEHQRAIRVPGWFLRCEQNAQTRLDEHCLFVKPDDRWEYNEISTRCPDVVDQLTELFDTFAAAVRNNDPDQIPALPPLLLHGFS